LSVKLYTRLNIRITYPDEKSAEMIMFRPTFYGGLGILCPKFGALAFLIRSFLDTAAKANFRRNLFRE
jgi:hypothetical protein